MIGLTAEALRAKTTGFEELGFVSPGPQSLSFEVPSKKICHPEEPRAEREATKDLVYQ
jgi:hypothetical protein